MCTGEMSVHRKVLRSWFLENMCKGEWFLSIVHFSDSMNDSTAEHYFSSAGFFTDTELAGFVYSKYMVQLKFLIHLISKNKSFQSLQGARCKVSFFMVLWLVKK